MKNILSLNNGVKVNMVDGDKIVIISDSVKILLDNNGKLIYIENLVSCKEQGPTEKVEIVNKNSLDDDMQKVISNFLHEIGIPTNIKGYYYLKTAILLAYNDQKCLDGICKKLYPKVAKIHDTTVPRAERAIRHAIEVAWDRGNSQMLDELFAASINRNKGKATNGEFISFIVEKLKND